MTSLQTPGAERRPMHYLANNGLHLSVGLPTFLLVASIIIAIIVDDSAIRGGFVIVAIGSLTYFCARAPLLGCIIIIFLVLVLDNITWQFSTLTHDLGFYLYSNWWKLISLVSQREFDLLKINTVELLMLASAIGITLQGRRKGSGLILTPESLLAVGFLLVVTLMFILGIWNEGELKPALWQVRPYFHLLAICMLLTQTIRNERDLHLVTWTLITAVTLKAAQVIGIFFFMAHGRFNGWRQIVGHEDSIFFVAALALLFALWLYDKRLSQRFLLSCLSAIVFAGLLLNLRRAGYAALGLTLLLMPLVAHQRRRLAAGLLTAMSVAAIIYLALFWNSLDALGLPAQKVRSMFSAVSGTVDYDSNTYRTGENINLWYTIVQNPWGTGFGKPFEMLVPLDDISKGFPNWQYHPHNMVLGLWASLGTIGFITYLTFICGVMGATNFAVKQSNSNFVKAVAVFGFLALSAGLFAGAVDQFISDQRGAIFLGVVIGMISAISSMQGRIVRSADDDARGNFGFKKRRRTFTTLCVCAALPCGRSIPSSREKFSGLGR
jgi:O-antigen ligase